MAGGVVRSSTGSEMKLRSAPRAMMMTGTAFAGIVLVLGMLAIPAGAATAHATPKTRALTCTDSWKAAVPGQWTDAANWNTGVVPTSSDNVCIKVAGTYGVTISGNASAGTITLGGSSGKQTLKIKGSPAASSSLSLSDATGSEIGANGALKLLSKNVADSGSAELYGPSVTLVNKGTFETKGGEVNDVFLRVNLMNSSTGTVKIEGITTDDGAGGATTLTNDGAFSVGSTGSLILSGNSSFTQSGGTIANSGTLTQDGGTFTQSGGADSGTEISVVNGTLTDSAGAADFDLYGSVSLDGTIPSGQTVDAIGDPSYSTDVEITANLTNSGTFELDSENVSDTGSAELYGPSVTLTNAGTFETEGGADNAIYLRTSVTNDTGKTTSIDGITTDDGAGGATTLNNEGAFSVGSGDSLILSGNSSFTQSGGTIVNNGTLTQDGGTFTQSGGTDSGTEISVINGTLADSAGAAVFDLYGSISLNGTIPSTQTVDAIANPSYSTDVEITATVTNNGTFELDSENVADTGSAELYGPSETLDNAGTFETVGGADNSIYLRTSVKNTGTVSIDGTTTDDGAGGATTLTNLDTFSVGTSGGITLSGNSSFTQSSGTLTNSGTLTQDGGTFTQSGGTDSGTEISVINGTLTDSAGAADFDLYGSISLNGTIPSTQTVDAIASPSYSTDVEITATVTNNGTFELDSENVADTGSAELYGPSETLDNAGTFETVGGADNGIYLRTSVTNTGTVTIDGITTDDGAGGATTLSNSGTFSVDDGEGITFSGNSTFTLGSGGTFSPTVDASTGVWGITGGFDPSVGGKLAINTVGAPALDSTYNVINGATGLTGTFSSVSGSYTVTYSSTAVTAKFT